VDLRGETERTALSPEKLEKVNEYRQRFFGYMEDDLKTPEAIAVMWEVLKSNIPGSDKYDLLVEFDEVLGFGFRSLTTENVQQSQVIGGKDLPAEVAELIEKRKTAKSEKNWGEADALRASLESKGYLLKDLPNGEMEVSAKK
jgi:cysteinyl-tRNA synthetase